MSGGIFIPTHFNKISVHVQLLCVVKLSCKFILGQWSFIYNSIPTVVVFIYHSFIWLAIVLVSLFGLIEKRFVHLFVCLFAFVLLINTIFGYENYVATTYTMKIYTIWHSANIKQIEWNENIVHEALNFIGQLPPQLFYNIFSCEKSVKIEYLLSILLTI